MARSFRSFPQGSGTARPVNHPRQAVSVLPRRRPDTPPARGQPERTTVRADAAMGAPSLACRLPRSGRRLPGGPPGEQLLARGVLSDGTVVETDRQEEVVRLAEYRPGADAEGGRDLVAVELRADARELL